MRRIEISDSMIELAEAVILQAVEDFRGLRDLGVFGSQYEVHEWMWDRCARVKGDRHYGKPKQMRSADAAKQLVYFLTGPALDYWCALVGFPACRIRRVLGLKMRVAK